MYKFNVQLLEYIGIYINTMTVNSFASTDQHEKTHSPFSVTLNRNFYIYFYHSCSQYMYVIVRLKIIIIDTSVCL